MKYRHIKQAKLSHEQIATYFGYKTTATFRRTSAHRRIMQGIDQLLGDLFMREGK